MHTSRENSLGVYTYPLTPRATICVRFFQKKQEVNSFVTFSAPVWQVVWPVSLVYNLCDLNAHTRQVEWSQVLFTPYICNTSIKIIRNIDLCLSPRQHNTSSSSPATTGHRETTTRKLYKYKLSMISILQKKTHSNWFFRKIHSPHIGCLTPQNA
jgi:hypothetical protein